MDLIRESGSPDFKPREASLLRRIAPHLGNGLKMAALRVQIPVEEGATDVPGVLTLDYRGRVVQHTPEAERWLRDLEHLRPGWRERGDLPRAVLMVVLSLRRALSPERARDEASVPTLRARARSGRWLTLYGSMTEATPERRAETVIIIEPTKPEELLPFSMSAYGLSPREEELVELVVRGLSTTRISRTLFISEHTVQNHLRSVFEKVGVRSRGELVKRLFFDNLYPTLFR
jgi:DNA-binding CsgD family transcriptional regulator